MPGERGTAAASRTRPSCKPRSEHRRLTLAPLPYPPRWSSRPTSTRPPSPTPPSWGSSCGSSATPRSATCRRASRRLGWPEMAHFRRLPSAPSARLWPRLAQLASRQKKDIWLDWLNGRLPCLQPLTWSALTPTPSHHPPPPTPGARLLPPVAAGRVPGVPHRNRRDRVCLPVVRGQAVAAGLCRLHQRRGEGGGLLWAGQDGTAVVGARGHGCGGGKRALQRLPGLCRLHHPASQPATHLPTHPPQLTPTPPDPHPTPPNPPGWRPQVEHCPRQRLELVGLQREQRRHRRHRAPLLWPMA